MEFSHKGSLVLDAATMSGMNDGHLCGQSCFNTCNANTYDMLHTKCSTSKDSQEL